MLDTILLIITVILIGVAAINIRRIDEFGAKVYDYIMDAFAADEFGPINTYDEIPQSSVAGVAFDTEKQLWRVRFRVDGFRKHFGYFETQKDAEARCLAERNNLLNSGSSIASCKE